MKTQFEQMMDGLNDVEAFLSGEQERGGERHIHLGKGWIRALHRPRPEPSYDVESLALIGL